MSLRRHLIMWLVANPVVLLIVVGILVWRRASIADQWNTFLSGDPHTGAEIFQQKGCISCHTQARTQAGGLAVNLMAQLPAHSRNSAQ
jgi:hypothetical protein